MVGATSSVEGVLADFLTPILLNIGGEPIRERLINIHRLVSGSAASMALKLGGGRYGQLVLMITADE